MRSILLTLAAALLTSAAVQAQGFDTFSTGPLIEGFGPHAPIENEMPIPEGMVFRHSYDIADEGEAGSLNRRLVTAARFLNMHAAAGVPAENMRLALVIHGGAIHDVADTATYGARHDGAENANAALIAALIENGVEIYVCGQSAVYYGVDNDELLPGVTMALSAMTAHAILQQDGYTLNPF
ncbi:DsrE family protein [Maricaulis sp.]|uniref:DsrE family protein n=1 Tax=Maricaulis sp. TaxID=1486257 RepID=UPI00260550A7|nr:DsrE family protein [Maricaulis sp.]